MIMTHIFFFIPTKVFIAIFKRTPINSVPYDSRNIKPNHFKKNNNYFENQNNVDQTLFQQRDSFDFEGSKDF